MKALFIVTALTLPLVSFAEDMNPLNVKLGLWEVTASHSVSGMSGMPKIPAEALAKMPEERRAHIESLMKSAGSGTTTVKDCITKEKLAKNQAFSSKHNECKHEIVRSSAKNFQTKFVCDAKHGNTKGDLIVEAVDDSNVKGTMKVIASGHGHEMAIDMTFSSKYLGPDCGDVK
jgi:hypothetical protein